MTHISKKGEVNQMRDRFCKQGIFVSTFIYSSAVLDSGMEM